MYMATVMQFIFIRAVFLAEGREKAPDYVWLLQGERERGKRGPWENGRGYRRDGEREREGEERIQRERGQGLVFRVLHLPLV